MEHFWLRGDKQWEGVKWGWWGQNAELVGGNQLGEMQQGQAMPA